MMVRDWTRFGDFLDGTVADIAPEIEREPHPTITRQMIAHMVGQGYIQRGMRALDVGCGQGLAMRHLQQIGVIVEGITLGRADMEICMQAGYDVILADQNFMAFADEEFDFLWCRHVLEHSIAPFFTISEYRRVTKPGGMIYVEVPAPGTSAHHENNPNHYSVLTADAWASLFERSKLRIAGESKITFEAECGPDVYLSFVLVRE